MKKFFSDFKKFISRGNVVDMAVGVAVATAFTAIVTAFTKGFISPLLALLTGDSNLSEAKWVIREAVLDAEEVVITPEVAILWGAFVQAIIDFLIIAFALFLLLRVAFKVSEKARKIAENTKKTLDPKAEAEAKAAAEAEAAAKAEAEAAAAAAKEAADAAAAAEKAREEEQMQLLRDIRDLLKK